MKKFTGNFLLGGHGMWHALRKIGLSMVVALITMVTFSQEHQDTYHIYAETIDSCYQQDNDYIVWISFKDFVKIKQFNLGLNYDDTKFEFVPGETEIVATELTTGTGTVVTESAGLINFAWANTTTPQSILPDNNITGVIKLHFHVIGFQHNYATTSITQFVSALTWETGTGYFMKNDQNQEIILTNDKTTNGSITVNQLWDNVVVDPAAANCTGTQARAQVTDPLDDVHYSFNGASFEVENWANVTAGQNNFVAVRGDGTAIDAQCVSYIKTFTAAQPEPISFTVDSIQPICENTNGEITVDITGGTGPFTVWLIPSADLADIYSVFDDIDDYDNAAFDQYKFTDMNRNPVFEVPGTETYYVAVDDANSCMKIDIAADLANSIVPTGGEFKSATIVEGTNGIYVASDTVDHAQCFGFFDGRFGIKFAGGNPWMASGSPEYIIHLNTPDFEDGPQDRWWDGGTYPKTDSVGVAGLHAGSYVLTVTDSVGCVFDTTLVIDHPAKIEFDMVHTDASCNLDNGTMWVDTATLEGGHPTTDFAGWTWVYSKDPAMVTLLDTLNVGDTAVDLMEGAYYVKVYDPIGCVQQYRNVENDDAVKILNTVLNVDIEPIKCYGDITEASVIFEAGSGNHPFSYQHALYDTTSGGSVTNQLSTWADSSTFENIQGDTFYLFEAYDSLIGCYYDTVVWISQPTELMIDIDTATSLGPTCAGYSDGQLVTNVTGGTKPYWYRYDDLDWVQGTAIHTFATDTGLHYVTVKDANECTTYDSIYIGITPNLISVRDTFWNHCVLDSVNLLTSYHSGWDTLSIDSWINEGDFLDWSNQTQYDREPEFYISSTTSVATEIALAANKFSPDTLMLPAGEYWIVAMDEWGCLSNVEHVVVIDPPALTVDTLIVGAGCYPTFSGELHFTAYNGQKDGWTIQDADLNDDLTDAGLDPVRYAYVLVQSGTGELPPIFNQADWPDQVSWAAFPNTNGVGDDSTAVIAKSRGTYYLAVMDYCAEKRWIDYEDESLIWGPVKIEITGNDPIELTKADIEIDSIWCYGDTSGVLDATNAVTGGYGAYDPNQYVFSLWQGSTKLEEQLGNGRFEDLPAGTYTIAVTDTAECPGDQVEITVWGAPLLTLDIDTAHVSCVGLHDGVIRYHIAGGVPPYYEVTNNISENEPFTMASQIPDERWYMVPESDMVGSLDSAVFDRRVRAGSYNIWVKDSRGCVYDFDLEDLVKDPWNVVVLEPKLVEVDIVDDHGPVCVGENTGWIEYTIVGGWESDDDNYMYEVTVDGPGSYSYTQTVDYLDTLTIPNLEQGNYVFTVSEVNSGLTFDSPIIEQSGYFNGWDTIVGLPWQNANEDCPEPYTHTLADPNALTYDRYFVDARCHNEESGIIHIFDLAGGTKPYTLILEGPDDFSDNGLDTVYLDDDDTEYKWDNLIWGHYNIIIKDDVGCSIFEESAEIENPADLELQVMKVKDPDCYDGNGIIKLIGTGGSGMYEYAVDTAWVPDSYEDYFPLEDANYVASLPWQTGDQFEVPAGIWIGFVRDLSPHDSVQVKDQSWMPFNDTRVACIEGWATDRDGNPIDKHRVELVNPTPIVGSVEMGEKPLCYGDENGTLIVNSISGSTPLYAAHVTGTDFEDNPVDKWYFNLDGSEAILDSLRASYWYLNDDTPDNWSSTTYPEDFYWVEFVSALGCTSVKYPVALRQDDPFLIKIEAKQDAFICWDDKAGLYDIVVTQGGEAFPGDDFEFMWTATDTTTGLIIDSLTGDWGFTPQFLGYAGYRYDVTARDVNGCLAYADTFVTAPKQILFDVTDHSCFDDSTAYAHVEVTQESWAGRTYEVMYQQVTGVNSDEEIMHSAWMPFSGDTLLSGLSYGDIAADGGHYWFYVRDELGCEALRKFITFVPVQHPLTMDVVIDEAECDATATVEVTGGIPPYDIYVNGDMKTTLDPYAGVSEVVSGPITLETGSNVIKVVDAHERCMLEETHAVTGNPVARTDEVETIIDETTAYVDAEAGVDTVLGGGTHIFTYTHTNGCTRTLTVTVTEVIPEVTIATIQGSVEVSPYVGKTVKTTGTVTAVGTGGYYIQDASAAWSGIWVADATSTVAEGNGVEVSGVVSEENSVTTITPITGGVDLLTTAPATITPVEVATPADAGAEMYESVLVTVVGARANAADPTTKEWVVYTETTSTATIAATLYEYTPTVDNFYDVTGVVDGAASAYTVNPRKEADVVDLTATENDPELNAIEFKVYPNPFNTYIKIDNAHKLTRVVLSNIAGQRVLDIEYPDSEIRTPNLVSGVYVVTLFTDSGIAKTERIVKR